jgi:hypothetical protein
MVASKILKNFFVYLIVLSIPITARSQQYNDSSSTSGAKTALLDTIVRIFQTSSVYKNKVNWSDLKSELYSSIDYSASNSVLAVIPAYVKLSKILNITHGGLTYNGKPYGVMNEELQEMQNRISNTIQEAAIKNEYSFRVEVLNKEFGYISIPPVEIEFAVDMEKVKLDLAKKASVLQDSLCKLGGRKLKGIILDLRLNNGGSTPVMFGGLTSLYDKGTLFSFVMGNGPDQKVIKEDKYITFAGDTLVKLESKCPSLNQLKLAILISPFTASAAEQIAISFKSRNKTIFIGERTRGMTTGIQTVAIRNDLTLDYAQMFSVDRNGNNFELGVYPDITVVGGDDFRSLQNDKKVQRAIKWISKK